jgi:hypothetical protein
MSYNLKAVHINKSLGWGCGLSLKSMAGKHKTLNLNPSTAKKIFFDKYDRGKTKLPDYIWAGCVA